MQKLENGIIKDPKVERAMLSVDRGNYVDYDKYSDSPASIGYGATISAPHMVNYSYNLPESVYLIEHLFF